MELSWNTWMLMTTVVLMLLLVAATPPNQRKLLMVPEGCPETCGGTQISYPFGIGNSSIDPQQPCFMGNGKFNLSCQSKSKLHVAKHNFNVTEINLEGWMVVSFYVSRFCHGDKEKANNPFLTDTSLTISSRANKFIKVGCDSFGYLNSNYEGATYSTGCLTRCYTSNPDMQIEINSTNGRCAGLGCCQVDIPPRMKDITIQVSEFPKTDADRLLRKSCSYSFIAKKDSYHFSVADLSNANLLSNKRFPMVVNWAVTNESCQVAKKTKQDYACKENSECEDNDKDIVGYRCKCQHGFEGNPYLGCKAKCLRLRGEERPCMKEVAMELEGLMLMDKKSWINKDMRGDETCYLLREASSSIYETGGHSSSNGDTGGGEGYDSLKDHVLIALDDDGR